jgi:histidinol-phosphatase (PHP family)
MTARLPAGRTGGQLRRISRGLRRRWFQRTRRARELDASHYGGLVDYHIHTKLCGHARGEPVDYVREAQRLGLREIGFADHMPLLRIRDEHLTMRPDELPLYVEIVRELQRSVDGMDIRLGIEMDYIPGQMDEIWDAASGIDFDYVYGAVHYIDGWDFGDSRRLSSYQGRDPDEMYVRYFDLFCEAAHEGGFDVMAHPDLVKKHGVVTSLPMEETYERVAQALKDADVAIEVNTSGLRVRAAESYPHVALLSACARKGVPVTLGSDAHRPEQVGADFDVALRQLARAGIREIATFQRRSRTLRSI